MKVALTAEQVATTIQSFLDGRGGPWDWDDFIAVPISDAKLDKARARCVELSAEFPATEVGQYCGPRGIEILRGLVQELREMSV